MHKAECFVPVQQSATVVHVLPVAEKSRSQLSIPHTRFPTHSESSSQSPPPKSHGLDSVQHEMSVVGIPLQPAVTNYNINCKSQHKYQYMTKRKYLN